MQAFMGRQIILNEEEIDLLLSLLSIERHRLLSSVALGPNNIQIIKHLETKFHQPLEEFIGQP